MKKSSHCIWSRSKHLIFLYERSDGKGKAFDLLLNFFAFSHHSISFSSLNVITETIRSGSCNCSLIGTTERGCNTSEYMNTGQCPCLAGHTGRQCLQCMAGYYQLSTGQCRLCDCKAATSQQCGPGGQCLCRDGAAGQQCDRCSAGHYDWSMQGCK